MHTLTRAPRCHAEALSNASVFRTMFRLICLAAIWTLAAQAHAVTKPTTYTVTVVASPSNAGAVSGGGTFTVGSNRSVAAKANAGWIFSGWTEGGRSVSSSANYSFSVQASRSLVAIFVPVNYTISVSGSPSSGGTVAGGGAFANGSTQTVTATPSPGNVFSGWNENGKQVSTSAVYRFTVSGNRSLAATFVRAMYSVSVTASPTKGGAVGGAGTFASGTVLSVSCSTNTGYGFNGWYENGKLVSSKASYAFTVTGNRSLTASFVAVNYTLTLDPLPTKPLSVAQSTTISGILRANGNPAPAVSLGINDGFSLACYTVTTDAAGRFRLSVRPLFPGATLLEFRAASSVFEYAFDVEERGLAASVWAQSIAIRNTSARSLKVRVSSPFNNHPLEYVVKPQNTTAVVRMSGPKFVFKPTVFAGATAIVGAGAAGGHVALTVDNTGTSQATVTVGGAVLLRFSAYTTTALDAGLCWSPGGDIGAGTGIEISGSLCIGSDGINLGGDIGYGVVTDGFSIQVLEL